jgi:class III lanthionine synthetase
MLKDNFLYRLLDKDHNESFSRYTPDPRHLYQTARSILGDGWTIDRGDFWYMCYHEKTPVPLQGWKIHVSTAADTAGALLEVVVGYLAQRNDTAFKFALDFPILMLMLSKTWARGASGKFITIYPQTESSFREILHDLDSKTAGFEGPYILSDRRYRNNKVLYYRYGGMALKTKLNVKGEKVPVLVTPDRTEIPDVRTPYFSPPSWVTDPFETNEAENMDMCLNKGKYQVESVLAYSNAGGIYEAKHVPTGETVLIKEARPYVYSASGDDVTLLLKKEFALLQELADEGVAPRPVEYFEDWEHHYLAEEFVQGQVLVDFAVINSIFLRTRPSRRGVRAYFRKIFRLFAAIAEMLDKLHSRGIVFGDFSPNNIIVCPDARSARFIDFEGSYRTGIDQPGKIYTPGFAEEDQVHGQGATFQSDCYSLGQLIAATLMPVTSLNIVKPGATAELLDQIRKEYSVPQEFNDFVLALLLPDKQSRPSASEANAILKSLSESMNEREVSFVSTRHKWAAPDAELIQDIAAYITKSGNADRTDRLFPSDPKLFNTNPVSMAYGAAGVIYALQRMHGKVEPRFVEWVIEKTPSNDACPPGLWIGKAGVAWTLLEAGYTKEAQDAYHAMMEHPLLSQGCDIFYGMAGCGLTALRFFAAFKDESFLADALDIAEKLLARSKVDQRGACWPDDAGDIHLGFAHGASGIALFLLYLYCTTGDTRFLEHGCSALDHDFSHAYATKDGGWSWPYTTTKTNPVLPYWKHGSAGIGSVVLRYWHCTGEKKYKEALERIYLDTDRKYTVYPGRFYGLSGIGNFHCDCFHFTHQQRFLNSARKAAEGLKLFAVKREHTAFPGDGLSRISCDYGTGSAGVMAFLDRLHRQTAADLMVDELLIKKPQSSVRQEALALSA